MNNEIENRSNLLSILKERRIVIYGTGYVAMRFYRALGIHNLAENITCFAVTDMKNQRDTVINGIKVQAIAEIEIVDDMMVCIAVHESIKPEIEKLLVQRGIEKFIWIYPYLHDLLLGEKIAENRNISVDFIISKNDGYGLAIKYLALEQYYKKNQCGFAVYVKAQAMHCEEETAKKRLDKFCQLIASWEKCGYQPDRGCVLDESYRVIDGYHRIALAKYHQQEEIICNVYQCSKELVEEMGNAVGMTKQDMIEAGFTLEELAAVEEVYNRIRRKTDE